MKYQVALLAVLCTLGAGAADAANDAAIGLRNPVQFRADGPREPNMQPRDGDYSWCDDRDGGLACGVDYCWENPYDSVSICEITSWNKNFP